MVTIDIIQNTAQNRRRRLRSVHLIQITLLRKLIFQIMLKQNKKNQQRNKNKRDSSGNSDQKSSSDRKVKIKANRKKQKKGKQRCFLHRISTEVPF